MDMRYLCYAYAGIEIPVAIVLLVEVVLILTYNFLPLSNICLNHHHALVEFILIGFRFYVFYCAKEI